MLSVAVFFGVSAFAGGPGDWHYPYVGAAWDEVNPVCTGGMEQSPINLPEAIEGAEQPTLQINWNTPVDLQFTNEALGVKWNLVDSQNTLTFDGLTYTMLQFHCHTGSEHRVNHYMYDLECHFVHQAESGEYAVVGLFADAATIEGPQNLSRTSEALHRRLQAQSNGSVDTNLIEPLAPTDNDNVWDILLGGDVSGFDVSTMVAEADLTKYYTYPGSFTTPPCTEGVQWIVLKDAAMISDLQYASLIPMADIIDNFRPPMPLNDRVVEQGPVPGAKATGWHYPYIGTEWDEVNPVCTGGVEQSPINLPAADDNLMQEMLDLKWGNEVELEFKAKHGVYWGLTDRVNTLTFDGTTYAMLQFHCHAGSEHRVEHLQYDAECHFVHQSDLGEYAVVGLFISATSDEDNDAFGDVLTTADIIDFKVSNLLDRADLTQYWTYPGSFTTPPCTEGVQWIVLQHVLEISKYQFSQMIPMGGDGSLDNYRPPMPLHDRVVYQGEPLPECVMRDTLFMGSKTKIPEEDASSAVMCYEKCIANMTSNGKECLAWAFKDGKKRPCILFIGNNKTKSLQEGSGFLAGKRNCHPTEGKIKQN